MFHIHLCDFVNLSKSQFSLHIQSTFLCHFKISKIKGGSVRKSCDAKFSEIPSMQKIFGNITNMDADKMFTNLIVGKFIQRKNTDINLPRFGPFLGLDIKKDPSFSAVWKDLSVWKILHTSRRLKIATIWGVQWAKPPQKTLQTNLTFFFQEKAKNVAHSDEIHREKSYLMRKKKFFLLEKRLCSNENHRGKNLTVLLILLPKFVIPLVKYAKKLIDICLNWPAI